MTILPFLVFVCRNPGGTSEWLGNVIIASFIAILVCLTLVYFLSYVHLSGLLQLTYIFFCSSFFIVWGILDSVVIAPVMEWSIFGADKDVFELDTVLSMFGFDFIRLSLRFQKEA